MAAGIPLHPAQGVVGLTVYELLKAEAADMYAMLLTDDYEHPVSRGNHQIDVAGGVFGKVVVARGFFDEDVGHGFKLTT